LFHYRSSLGAARPDLNHRADATGIVQRSSPQFERRRAVPLSVEARIALPADIREILRAVRKDALSLQGLAIFEVKSGRGKTIDMLNANSLRRPL
jgi:hypothetical protein